MSGNTYNKNRKVQEFREKSRMSAQDIPFDDTATVTAALTPRQKIDDLNAMGRRNLEKDPVDPHRAITAAEQATALAKQGIFESDFYLEAIIESHLVQGLAYLKLSEESRALRHAIDALALCEEMEKPALTMQAATLMGVLEIYFDDYSSALEQLRTALEIARDLGNEIEQAKILYHLGRLYLKTTDISQALRHFEHSRQLSERYMLNRLLAETYRYSCDACAAIGEQDKALDFGQKALNMYRELSDTGGEAAILSSLGTIYTGAGAYSSAQTFFERSLNLAERENDAHSIALALKAHAELYLHSGDLDTSLNRLQKALQHARQTDDRSLQRDIHEDMSEIYRQQANYEKALHHHSFYHRLYQDVNNRETARQITRLDTLHQLEDVQRRADRDRQNNDLLQREIERRKKAEAELQARAERLERLEKLKTDMLRLAAHDLRTPLGIMMTTLEMFEFTADEDKPLNDRQKGYLSNVRQTVRDMLRMLEDILSMERIEQMYEEQNYEQFDLHERVSQAILDMYPQAQENKQYLKMSLQVTEALVMGDRPQIMEAIKNLIGNAIKYTPAQGTIEVSLQRDGDEVVFKVTDTGYGIPKDQQKDLFSPFYRAKSRETIHIKGTGLGLHLVKNIVERHSGSLIFSSVYKEGSTFGFRLPLQARDMPAEHVG